MYHLNKYDLNFVLHKFGYLNTTSKSDFSTTVTAFDMNNVTYQTPTMHVSIVMLLSCILLFGTIGNFLVIYIFGVKPGKGNQTKRFETYLTILGVVDLFSSFSIPATFIYLTMTNYRQWDFGYVGCKVIPSLLQFSISASHGVLLLITYELYQSIAHPFKGRLTNSKIYTWLIVAFLVSFILAIPYAMTMDIVNSPYSGVKTCLPKSDSQALQLASSCVYLGRDLFSVLAMFSLYYRMNRHLTRDYVVATWDRASFSQKGRKLLRTVVIVFVVMTLPLDIFQAGVLTMFFTDGKEAITPSIYENLVLANTILQILQMSNSVSNIFVYSRRHSNFRQFLSCFRQKQDDDDDGKSVTRKSTISENYRASIRFRDIFDETDFSIAV